MTRAAPHRILAVLALAATLSACGTSPGTPSAGSTDTSSTPAASSTPTTSTAPDTTPPLTESPATTTAAGGPSRCKADALQGTVQPKDSAAGNRYAELVVTNKGATACTLQGYGGLGLVDVHDTALPTRTARDEKPGPSLITLAPGKTAGKLLHWGVVPTGDEPVDKPCEPTAAKLTVIPPDERQAFTVAWDLGPVCAGGTFHDSAFYAL